MLYLKAQASWIQHDFGHLSVFKKSKLNHLLQNIIICTIKVIISQINNLYKSKISFKKLFFINLKGVSSDWWNYRHYQHHAKPNTIRKDPDIRFGALFVLGKIIPREVFF